MADDSLQGPPHAPAVTDCQPDDGGGADTIDYDSDTDTYRASFDSATDSVPMAVLSTVATVAETDPTALQSLHSVVDPDALDALMRPAADTPERGDVHVSFTLDGHDVTVHSYGIVAVQPPEDTSP